MFAVLFLFCCKVRCSHSYVTIVVWLWHLTLTKSILTCILPRNPNSHTAKIWSGLSKCRNISGIPEEICPGPQLNQEKAATLAQICHRKSVFLAQTLPKTFMRSWRWEEEAARCLCFGAQHRKDKKKTFLCLPGQACRSWPHVYTVCITHAFSDSSDSSRRALRVWLSTWVGFWFTSRLCHLLFLAQRCCVSSKKNPLHSWLWQ